MKSSHEAGQKGWWYLKTWKRSDAITLIWDYEISHLITCPSIFCLGCESKWISALPCFISSFLSSTLPLFSFLKPKLLLLQHLFILFHLPFSRPFFPLKETISFALGGNICLCFFEIINCMPVLFVNINAIVCKKKNFILSWFYITPHNIFISIRINENTCLHFSYLSGLMRISVYTLIWSDVSICSMQP